MTKAGRERRAAQRRIEKRKRAWREAAKLQQRLQAGRYEIFFGKTVIPEPIDFRTPQEIKQQEAMAARGIRVGPVIPQAVSSDERTSLIRALLGDAVRVYQERHA